MLESACTVEQHMYMICIEYSHCADKRAARGGSHQYAYEPHLANGPPHFRELARRGIAHLKLQRREQDPVGGLTWQPLP